MTCYPENQKPSNNKDILVINGLTWIRADYKFKQKKYILMGFQNSINHN